MRLFSKIIHVWAGRFQVEIGDFVTKRRSGFGLRGGGGGGGEKRMLQTRGRMLAPNLMSVSQLRLSLSGFPEGTAEAPSRPSSRKDRDEGRRSPLSGCTSGSSVGRCPASASKDENAGPPGRSGFLPVHQSDVENPRCRSRSPVRCTARMEARRSRRSTKVWACLTGPAARSALALLCPRRGRNPRKAGGMTPSCLKRLLTRVGKRWKTKKEEAMDREAETVRGGAPSHSTGFRFAPTGTRRRAGRPAERSVARTALA